MITALVLLHAVPFKIVPFQLETASPLEAMGNIMYFASEVVIVLQSW
jgi:hypothetical protein